MNSELGLKENLSVMVSKINNFSPQTVQYPQSAATSIKREPSEDKNYVELDTPHKIPTVQQMQTNNPQSVNTMAIPNMTTSVVPVNMDEQVSFRLL